MNNSSQVNNEFVVKTVISILGGNLEKDNNNAYFNIMSVAISKRIKRNEIKTVDHIKDFIRLRCSELNLNHKEWSYVNKEKIQEMIFWQIYMDESYPQ